MTRAHYFVSGYVFMVAALASTSFAGQDTYEGEIVKQLKSSDLLDVLPSLELLREARTGSGLAVRVFRTTSDGECDPGNEAKTCPHTKLFIVSGINEEGMRLIAVWETASLIGWEADDLTQGDAERAKAGTPAAVVLSATACEAPRDIESGKMPAVGGARASSGTWWRKIRYQIQIGVNTILVRKIGQPGEYCDLY